MTLASVSVDLDGIRHYCRIYGIDSPLAGDQVYTLALPRLLDLFDEVGIPATFFVIGEDAAPHRDLLREAVARGFRLGNHSHTHPYGLAYLPPARVREEIVEAHRTIEAASGHPPVGFRAPGYVTGPRIHGVLAELGYVYESSELPSVPYYLARLGAIAWMRLLPGRSSGSHPGSPRSLLGGKDPRVDRATGLVHVPITVRAGLPAIGQVLHLLGPKVFSTWFSRHVGSHLHLELHGVDALGLVEDRLPEALGVQPDLKLPLARKMSALREVLVRLKRGFEITTLEDLTVGLSGGAR